MSDSPSESDRYRARACIRFSRPLVTKSSPRWTRATHCGALQEHGCDLVVADIEMPRMDGFALREAIRSSTRFEELPVVPVTALETEHRTRGLR